MINKDKKVNISARIDSEVVKKINDFALMTRRNFSKMVEDLICDSLDNLDDRIKNDTWVSIGEASEYLEITKDEVKKLMGEEELNFMVFGINRDDNTGQIVVDEKLSTSSLKKYKEREVLL